MFKLLQLPVIAAYGVKRNKYIDHAGGRVNPGGSFYK